MPPLIVGCSNLRRFWSVKPGVTRSLYRAVDKIGEVINYYLSLTRDEVAAKTFLNKALAQNGLPDKIVIDGSKSNYATLDALNVQL